MNKIRGDPKSLIADLRKRIVFYDNRELRLPGHTPLKTKEGVGAVLDAINFLENQAKVPELKWNQSLHETAKK